MIHDKQSTTAAMQTVVEKFDLFAKFAHDVADITRKGAMQMEKGDAPLSIVYSMTELASLAKEIGDLCGQFGVDFNAINERMSKLT